jgi:hypothetical protein
MLRKKELYSLLVQKRVSSKTTQVSLTQEKGERTNVDIRITQYVEAMSKQNILRNREKENILRSREKDKNNTTP